MRVDGVLESCLYAADLDAAAQFYVKVLGLERVGAEPERHVFFRCGGSMVLIFNPAQTTTSAQVNGAAIPPHGTTGAGHLAFRVPPEELSAWRDHLAANGVAIESEVAWPQGGHSIYFRDPAGNCLELATPQLWGFT